MKTGITLSLGAMFALVSSSACTMPSDTEQNADSASRTDATNSMHDAASTTRDATVGANDVTTAHPDTGSSGGRDTGTVRNDGGSGTRDTGAMTHDSGTTVGPADAGPINQSTMFFPANTPWYTDVSSAPVDPNSDSVITYFDSVGFGTGHIQIDFSIEVLHADSSTPRMTFTPTGDFYDPDCDHVPVPVPVGGNLEGESGYACTGDGDCHLLVVEESEHKLYEMWRANITGGTFEGGCMAVWDMTRVYPANGRGDGCTSADAAGYPITPLLFNADEVTAAAAIHGSLNHAIRFILPNSRIRRQVFFNPATHGTNTTGPATAVPYGGRLRLRADYPVDSLPSEGAKVIARTLQRYGMMLADGGQIALTAQNDTHTTAHWNGLLDALDLEAIQPSDFQLLALQGTGNTHINDCTRNP